MIIALLGVAKRYPNFTGIVSNFMRSRLFLFYIYHFIWVVLFQYILYGVVGQRTFVLFVGTMLLAYLATFICCEVLKRIKNESKNGVYFASTVGEETTGRGSTFATSMVNPTLAIILDVGSSSDVAYRDNFTRDVKLGNGPMFTIASNGSEILCNMLKDIANKNNIPYQEVVEYSKTWTDFDTIYKQNGGIPSTLISIPLRYMHSSVEVGSLKDVEHIVNLLVEFIKSLDESITFDPFK